MRIRCSPFPGVAGRWRIILCFLLLSLAAVNAFSQAPPKVDEPGGAAPSNPPLQDEEPQARAWLAIRQKERGQLKKLAEGIYLIKSNFALGKSQETSEASDEWTLWKLENGEFQVDGEFKASKSAIKASSTSYQVDLNPQMRPVSYKLFGRKLVSGCVWTESKLFCQETDHNGEVQGAAGASIDNSTRFLSPLFPFLFNALTPNAKIQPGEMTYLTLLSLSYSDEPGALIDLIPEYASLKLIRRGTYSIPQANTEGSEFQLGVREIPGAAATNPQAPVIPPDPEREDPYKPFCKFVVSSNGILLSASDVNTQKEFIRLVQFKKFAVF